jgi:hypothetical protein
MQVNSKNSLALANTVVKTFGSWDKAAAAGRERDDGVIVLKRSSLTGELGGKAGKPNR